MNWDDLRFVLAVAKAGSLARAARDLKVDHTTVGRRIEAFERDLGVTLFARTPSGYVLTAEAEELLPEIQQVEAAVLAVERSAHAGDGALRGLVRVTANEAFGSRYLAPRLAPFARRHPEITVEVATGNQILDLARREADVAVRTFRSKQEHLVVKRAADMGFGLYASEEYLRDRPTPVAPDDLREHDVVLDDASTPWPTDVVWLQRMARGARVTFQSNSTAAVFSAARAGLGIALLPRFLGDPEPSLRHIPMPDEPVRTIWLTVHRDLRLARRVRAVLDHLAEVMRADAALLLGRPAPGRAGRERAAEERAAGRVRA